jgi:hypothetical protein
MAFNTFTLPQVLQTFHFTVETSLGLFEGVPSVPISQRLRETLEINAPLALAVNTEKARSEWLIAPILSELWQRGKGRISILSGVDLSVDPEEGLNGVCDFLVGRGPLLPYVTAPLLAVVEAKNESIAGGLGPCAAEMVALYRFNQREGHPIEAAFGVVTSGNNWKFLRLRPPTLSVDLPEYQLTQADRILGILMNIVGLQPESA